MKSQLTLRLARASGFTLDVDIALPETGITVLFGPSGCGKTTLLRAAAGLERAAGRVAIAGEVWQDDAAGRFVPTFKRDIGYVFQDAALFSHLSVRENLAFGIKRAKGANAAALDEAVSLLGIGHLLASDVASLSGGEKQRVAIARAVAMRPAALFFDEPLSALDNARKAEILPWLERLKAELHIPMIYVTHAVPELLRLADRVVVLRDGRVRAQGAVTQKDVWAAAGFEQRLPTAIFEGTVAGFESGSAYVTSGACTFWLNATGAVPGDTVRMQIGAKDVSLALTHHDDTSISNIFPATVEKLEKTASGEVIVTLTLDGRPIYAALSALSVTRLGLKVGLSLFVQVKALALHR